MIAWKEYEKKSALATVNVIDIVNYGAFCETLISNKWRHLAKAGATA